MSSSSTPRKPAARPAQSGGFAVGLVVGLLIGLALALGVALYVTKVPIPFVNKVPQRSAEQDEAEAERTRRWDPNAPLQSRVPVGPIPGVTPPQTGPSATAPGSNSLPPVQTRPPAATAPQAVPPAPRTAAIPSPRPAGRDPAAILDGAPVDGTAPTEFYVQAGAFSRSEEAERQRASLAMLGFGARITEREQAGRTIYRVRLGPYARRAEADTARQSLDGNGIQAAVVLVQKSMN